MLPVASPDDGEPGERRAMQLTFAYDAPPPSPSGPVVPLSAEALHRCRQAGTDLVLIDDVVDRRDLVPTGDDYLRWQLRWIDEVADGAGYPEAGGTAAQLLKVPLDSAVVWARMLRAVVAALAPTAVGYVGPAGPEEADPLHNGHLQFWPRLGDVPLAARLLPLVARDLSLPYSADVRPPTSPPAPSPSPSASARVAARLAPLRHLSPRRPGRGPATLFTWTGGYGLPAIVRAERASGAKVLFLRRGGPDTAVLGLGVLGYGPVRPPLDIGLPPAPGPLPAGVERLLREVDEHAGLEGAGEVLRRRLEVLCGAVVPRIDALASGLAPQLSSVGVTRVVSTNAWSVEEFATLLAAGRQGIERVLYQHGDHAFSYDGWLVTETRNFDRMVASDPTVPADLEDGARRLAVHTPLFSVARHRRVPPGSGSTAGGGRRAVYYVPATLTGDTAVLPPTYFEDAWYLRWQLRLLGEMRARPGTSFVWKALPGSDQARDPLPDILERERISNVSYETRPFPAVLGLASRVVLDFPSTALYETVLAGVPTCALAFPRFAALRPRAVDLFAGVLHPCDDEDQAVDAVRRFLDVADQDARATMEAARARLQAG